MAAGNLLRKASACSAVTARGERMFAVCRQRLHDGDDRVDRLALAIDHLRKATAACAIKVDVRIFCGEGMCIDLGRQTLRGVRDGHLAVDEPLQEPGKLLQPLEIPRVVIAGQRVVSSRQVQSILSRVPPKSSIELGVGA